MRRALVLIVLAVLPLAACGSDDDMPPSNDSIINGNDRKYADAGWTTEIDPETDREFRCLTTWRKNGYGAGLSTWCYEVEP